MAVASGPGRVQRPVQRPRAAQPGGARRGVRGRAPAAAASRVHQRGAAAGPRAEGLRARTPSRCCRCPTTRPTPTWSATRAGPPGGRARHPPRRDGGRRLQLNFTAAGRLEQNVGPLLYTAPIPARVRRARRRPELRSRARTSSSRTAGAATGSQAQKTYWTGSFWSPVAPSDPASAPYQVQYRFHPFYHPFTGLFWNQLAAAASTCSTTRGCSKRQTPIDPSHSRHVQLPQHLPAGPDRPLGPRGRLHHAGLIHHGGADDDHGDRQHLGSRPALLRHHRRGDPTGHGGHRGRRHHLGGGPRPARGGRRGVGRRPGDAAAVQPGPPVPRLQLPGAAFARLQLGALLPHTAVHRAAAQPEPAVRRRPHLVPVHLRPDPAGQRPGPAALLDPQAAARPHQRPGPAAADQPTCCWP